MADRHPRLISAVDVDVVVQRVQEVLAVVRRVLLLANLGGEFAGINAGAAGTIAAVAADHDGGDVEREALTKIKTPETHQKVRDESCFHWLFSSLREAHWELLKSLFDNIGMMLMILNNENASLGIELNCVAKRERLDKRQNDENF